jgi:ketosteroid isomerase-like protein
MKLILLKFLVVISLVLVVSANGLLAQSVQNTDSSQILAFEDARFAAMTRADTSALAKMLAHDLVYVHSSGRAETKDEYLRLVGSRTLQYLSFVPVERRVTKLDPTSAVVTARANARVISKGQQSDVDFRYIGVYTRTDGRWLLRAWQTTRIAP